MKVKFLVLNVFYLFVLFVPSNILTNKVLIITHSFDRPDFIELQDKAFKIFLKDDYQFIVMNDASNENNRELIEQKCKQLKIVSIRIPQQIHSKRNNPTEAVSDSIQYTMNNFGFDYNGIVVIVDSDIFLIKSFNINEYLRGYDLSGHKQQRPLTGVAHVTYLWQGLIFMDMRTLPNKRSMNFDCGTVNGLAVDACGQLHHYLMNNRALKIKYYAEPVPDAAGIKISHLPNDLKQLKQQGYDNLTIDFILKYKIFNDPYSMEFHLDNKFIHYRAGGNWIKKSPSYHITKTNMLLEYLEKIFEKK